MVSRKVQRRRRQFAVGGAIVLLILIYLVVFSGGSGRSPSTTTTTTTGHGTTAAAGGASHGSPLDPGWSGNGKAVTLGFGGDVHFEGTVGANLANNPTTALGPGVAPLFNGTQLTMVNLESVITDGTCPEPQNKPYIFDAPASAVTALKSAGISVVTEGNDHGFDCGPQGLSQNLTIAAQANYPIVGIGATAAQAFAPARVTVAGQRIAIVGATQMIADNLVGTWTAGPSQPGVASAIDPTQLVREVQQVRRSADTVVVYVHWGTETQTCPDPQQEPLAQQLVKAGADVVIGSGAHVLLGAGYLGTAYVDYGLGNFAFYDYAPPETDSGSLILTARGRHITAATWRPATIVNGVPQPLSGAPATAAVASWKAARGCTDVTAAPSASLATARSQTVPFVAPAATTTTAPGSTTTSGATGTTTTAAKSAGGGTTTSTPASTTTTPPPPTTTSSTINAG